ncbi:MAG TPA: hypothetical protein VH480_12030 [Streptosporangiaceae bacterium]|jgi:hypothetical protein
MGFLAAIIILVAGGAVVLGVTYVRHETRPVARQSPVMARRVMRRRARVAAGDLCQCGGTIGKTGRISGRFGELLGCTGCNRSWTMDGRKIIRRTAAARRSTPGSIE